MMSGVDENESKLAFQAVEEKAKLNEFADEMTETEKNAEKNSSVDQSNESSVYACKDLVKDATDVSSKIPFSEEFEIELQSEISSIISNVKKNEPSPNHSEDHRKHISSAVVKSSTVRDLKDDSYSQSELQSENSNGVTAADEKIAMLSSFNTLTNCAVDALIEYSKSDLKRVFAHDSDEKIPPLVKVQDEMTVVSENGQMKLFMLPVTNSSLDVENKSIDSQKCESVKDSKDENHKKAEPPSSLINEDSGEDSNEHSKTLDRKIVVNHSIKSNEEKDGGDGKMSDMPMINITVSEGKMKYVSLSSTEKVFVPKNAVAEPLRSTPSPTIDLKDKKADQDNEVSEIPKPVNGKMSEMPMINIVSDENLQYSSHSSTEKVFVPKNTGDELLGLTQSPTTDLMATNAGEDKDLSDIPELVPVSMLVTSPTQLKMEKLKDFLKSLTELKGSSGRWESPPCLSPGKLFPKSKCPSPLEKPSPKETIPVPRSSVACGSDAMTNKPLEPESQYCPKCEGQETKTLIESRRSKHLYCVELSAHKRHAKRMDPEVIEKDRRFRIVLDVSLFENDSISIRKIRDIIEVHCKQVNINKYGEAIYEVRQEFCIPPYVEDSCFTATISENEELLIDAPLKDKEENNKK